MTLTGARCRVSVAWCDYGPYTRLLMQKGAAAAPFRHRHLLEIESLSPDDHVLDLADGHAETRPDALIMHPSPMTRGRDRQ